jgi:hypothetical protein
VIEGKESPVLRGKQHRPRRSSGPTKLRPFNDECPGRHDRASWPVTRSLPALLSDQTATRARTESHSSATPVQAVRDGPPPTALTKADGSPPFAGHSDDPGPGLHGCSQDRRVIPNPPWRRSRRRRGPGRRARWPPAGRTTGAGARAASRSPRSSRAGWASDPFVIGRSLPRPTRRGLSARSRWRRSLRSSSPRVPECRGPASRPAAGPSGTTPVSNTTDGRAGSVCTPRPRASRDHRTDTPRA